ncbi:tyrosine-protein kinase domain-containing protein [Calothrix sp. PCC 7507]|uniref:GumC family protein n=1 Tax=Calothrix sp. PCC 7507 TaxID=99598 RepID=UPI00029F3CDD|nr:tyrosine-protein kinase domain-containing protein [Calothrix sp. PCC 7507]AFY34778.1 lipopolysaccharide biosynthesis protein [Calothrix sp. PCC 7507]
MNKLVAIAIRHWKPLILWNLLVLGTTITIAALAPRVWMATTQLTVPGSKGNLDASLGVLGSLKNGGADIAKSGDSKLKLQESILNSDTLMEKLLANDPEKAKFKRLTLYKQLFKVSIEESSPIISITANGSQPELAKGRANRLTELFQQRLNELRQTNRNSRRQFSNKELEESHKNLLSGQQSLAQFQQSSGLVNADEQTKSIVSTIDSLTKSQSEALSQAAYSQNRVATLSTRLKMLPDKAIRSLSLGENKEYQFFRGKLSEVDANLASIRSKFNDDHPLIQQLLQQRETLLNQMKSQIQQAAAGTAIDTTVSSEGEGRARLIEQLILAETEASGQQRRAQQIQIQLNELKANLNSIPARQAKLAELQRSVDVAEGVYKGLVAQVQQTNIDVFDVYPNVEVLDTPRVDSKPVSPKLSLMVLNALLGGIIGSVALLLLLERRNPLLSPQDLQDMKFPIVVSIPRLKTAELIWELDDDKQVKFQRLASAVSLQPLENRRLLITSAMEGEGKTTVTLGLARALVDLGFRVLVVDGDFFQAELSSKLGYIPQSHSAPTPIVIEPQLDLLPAIAQQGKILKLVSRGQFKKALADAEAHSVYDYVLVDTAPLSNTTATALMTAQIPNVLFVVRQGISYSNCVRDSLEQLAQHQAQILGLVVNGVETAAKPYMQRLPDGLMSQST